MLAAITALSGGWQALFFGVATLLFLIAAVIPEPTNRPLRFSLSLIPFALALFTFVFFWNALALA